MFTRVRRQETDNAHAFLSTEYVIFPSFFRFFFFFFHIFLATLLLCSVSLVSITYTLGGQRNRDNGFVFVTHVLCTRSCARIEMCPESYAIFVFFFSFFPFFYFSYAFALQTFLSISTVRCIFLFCRT